MAGRHAEMRWWGWGQPDHPVTLPAHGLALLRERVGLAARPRPPVALSNVRLPRAALSGDDVARLGDVVGVENVRVDRAARVAHAAGRGYPDLVRLRAGEPEGAPDAVVLPGSREQLRALLGLCAERSIAVVPFGGGTSVVGGVAPLCGDRRAVLTLDMGRMDALVEVDETSRTVTAEAGLRVVEMERALGARGLTLGHFPQSFEYVSLGGCAATRSVGQASSGYGRFEEMVLGVGLCAPAGALDLTPMPASAAGPDLRETIVGSEGTLGVIDRLVLRVRAAPAERLYEGVFFEDFPAGVGALRELAQRGQAPDVARLSDEAETALSLALAGDSSIKTRLGRGYLRARGYASGCLAIFGFEDEVGRARERRRHTHRVVRAHGGLPVGQSPGRAWVRSRFTAPYLRDDLLTHGVMVETLETATTWSRLHPLYLGVQSAISGALERCGTPGLVGCHVSHLYETGASLYFTFIARQQEGAEIEQWRTVKEAATRAIVEADGTITHHHAVGRDHARWLEHEIGVEGVAMLQALKAELDPAGIMNPGKLIVQ